MYKLILPDIDPDMGYGILVVAEEDQIAIAELPLAHPGPDFVLFLHCSGKSSTIEFLKHFHRKPAAVKVLTVRRITAIRNTQISLNYSAQFNILPGRQSGILV